MIKKLDCFDFDGTLFKNPLDTPENRKIYERAKGMPWLINKDESVRLTKRFKRFIPMRRGWYGRPETLEPPLVPDPAPADMFIQPICEALHRSKADPEILTLLMTGRHGGIKHQVLRIAEDGGLVKVRRRYNNDNKMFCENIDSDVTCVFMGEDGPAPKGNKPTETLPWKVWILEQYVELHPEIETVEIWEDREAHVNEFRSLDGMLAPKVLVNFVTSGQ